MGDLLEIYSDLSSFTLANDILADIGDNTGNIIDNNVVNTICDNNLINLDYQYGSYVYIGIFAFCIFVLLFIYKIYITKYNMQYKLNNNINVTENDIENNILNVNP